MSGDDQGQGGQAHIVRRVDRYNVVIGDVQVVATLDQEARIAALSTEQRAAFAHIMGGRS